MEFADDPVEKARAAGLAYVSDEDPGIRRRRCGRGAAGYRPDVFVHLTAKDFRTWLGTVTLVDRLGDDDPGDPENRKTAWLAAVDHVADQLANTRSVARESYLPPDLESLYVEGWYHEQIGSRRLSRRIEELSVPGRRRAEPRTIALLEWLLTESGTGE